MIIKNIGGKLLLCVWEICKWTANTFVMILAFFGYRIFVSAIFILCAIYSLLFPTELFEYFLVGIKKIETWEDLEQRRQLTALNTLIKKNRGKRHG